MTVHRPRPSHAVARTFLRRVAIAFSVVAVSGGLVMSAGASAAAKKPVVTAKATATWIDANCKRLVVPVFKASFHLTPNYVRLEYKACDADFGYNNANKSTQVQVIINPVTAAQAKEYYLLDYNSLVASKNRAPMPGYTPISITLANVSKIGTGAYSELEDTGTMNTVALNSYQGMVQIQVAAYSYPSATLPEMEALSRAIYKDIAAGVK